MEKYILDRLAIGTSTKDGDMEKAINIPLIFIMLFKSMDGKILSILFYLKIYADMS